MSVEQGSIGGSKCTVCVWRSDSVERLYREEKGRDSVLYVLAWLRRGKNRKYCVCGDGKGRDSVVCLYLEREDIV